MLCKVKQALCKRQHHSHSEGGIAPGILKCPYELSKHPDWICFQDGPPPVEFIHTLVN